MANQFEPFESLLAMHDLILILRHEWETWENATIEEWNSTMHMHVTIIIITTLATNGEL